MTIQIAKRFTFEAGHRLGGLPEGHKCGRPHGHSYTVEVVVAGDELSTPGFVVDFADLAPVKRHLDDTYDHRFLNDVLDVEPTSENIARVLFDWCSANVPLPASASFEAVRVSETTTTWAEYRPGTRRTPTPASTTQVTGQTSSRPVPVAEMFHTFQGEGVNLGRRALFVRFMNCNLTCGYEVLPRSADAPVTGAMLCDTEYTWNATMPGFGEGARNLTPQEIWDELLTLDPSTADASVAPVDLIVASGGEPLLHQDALLHLAAQAALTGRRMEIETNATIRPREELIAAGVFFNAGLKLATSAVPRKKRIKEDAIAELQASGRARWKFVVCGPEDLEEIADLQREFGLTEVWLSPEGRTVADITARMKMVADAALRHGWNLTTREHVLVWGDERGR